MIHFGKGETCLMGRWFGQLFFATKPLATYVIHTNMLPECEYGTLQRDLIHHMPLQRGCCNDRVVMVLGCNDSIVNTVSPRKYVFPS